jgi:hypothetical protein
LLLGRAEDYETKGLDIAAASLGLLRRTDRFFEGAREPVLTIRGAARGTAETLRERLRKDAATGLQVNVKEYTADQAAIREDLARASVLMMPSRAEGFGLVALEALAMGVPVLVSKRSGVGELLMERVDANSSQAFLNELVIDIKDDLTTDTTAWADALKRVLRDREQSFARAAEARAILSEANYWDQSIREILGSLAFTARPPVGSELEQAQWWVQRDPVVAIGVASAVLEKELAQLAATRDRDGLPPRLALQVIGAHQLMSSDDLALAQESIHRRNQALHGVSTDVSETNAHEHVRGVAELIERIAARDKPRT